MDAHTHLIFGGNRANEFEMRCEGITLPADFGAGRRHSLDGKKYPSRIRGGADRDWPQTCPNGSCAAARRRSRRSPGYGLSVEEELKILRAIGAVGEQTPLRCVPTFLGAHEVPEEYRGNRSGYVSLVVDEMLPQVADKGACEILRHLLRAEDVSRRGGEADSRHC